MHILITIFSLWITATSAEDIVAEEFKTSLEQIYEDKTNQINLGRFINTCSRAVYEVDNLTASETAKSTFWCVGFLKGYLASAIWHFQSDENCKKKPPLKGRDLLALLNAFPVADKERNNLSIDLAASWVLEDYFECKDA